MDFINEDFLVEIGKKFAKAEGEVYGYNCRLQDVYVNEEEQEGNIYTVILSNEYPELTQEEIKELGKEWSDRINAIAKEYGVHLTMVDFTSDEGLAYYVKEGEGEYFDIIEQGNY